MEIPCKECLIIPLCRNKKYPKLIQDCYLVLNFLVGKEPGRSKRRMQLYNALKPKEWTLIKDRVYSSGWSVVPTCICMKEIGDGTL